MSAAALAAALLLGWIDAGIQPAGEGGYDYIIQVRPEQIDTFKVDGFESYVPPGVNDIRRIKIVVGDKEVPGRELLVEAAQAASEGRTLEHPSQTIVAKPPVNGNTTETADSAAADGQKYVARYGSQSDDSDSAEESGSFAAASNWLNETLGRVGLDPTTALAIGLGLALAMIVFLIWSHASMRSKYKALLHRLHDRPATG